MTPLTDRKCPKALRSRADVEKRLALDFAASSELSEWENSRTRFLRLRDQAAARAEECLALAAELEAAR